MQTFIYDHYGYYIEDEFAKEFEYEGWLFKLESHHKDEKELQDLNLLVNEMDNTLFRMGVRIIENQNHLLTSVSEFGNVSLVAVKKFNVSINDLLLIHDEYISVNNNIYDVRVSLIKTLWENKIDNVENKFMKNISIDDYDYDDIMTTIIYYIGLGENAVDYLEDIILDFGDKIKTLTITHKRLNEINSFDLLNPFNLVFDSPMRDIAELYKSGYLDNEQLLKLLTHYQLDRMDVSLLLARILFPTQFFDLLEDGYETNKNINREILKINKETNKKMKEVNLLHQQLINLYGIRPINWLLK